MILNENLFEELDKNSYKDFLEYLYDECLINTRNGVEFDNSYIDYEYAKETYSDDLTEAEYDKAVNILSKAVDNASYYNADSGLMLELSDRHTAYEIDEDVQLDPGIYWDIAAKYFESFERQTGIEIFTEGRSSRHICVKNTVDNLLRYDELCEIQKSLEEDFIKEINTTFGNKDVNESLTESTDALNSKIRDWYVEAIPEDEEFGKDIDPNATFADVLNALKKGEDVYEVFKVGDSVVRENIFNKLADIIDCDYDDIYQLWISEGKRSLKESLNESSDTQAIINNNIEGVNDKIKALQPGEELTIKTANSFGYDKMHIRKNYHNEYYTLWNTDPEGRVVDENTRSTLDNAMYWANRRFVSFEDNNDIIDEKLYDLSNDADERLTQLQGLVDNAVELFGRVPGSFYDDFDEIGYYITDVDGKYIVKKKVTNEALEKTGSLSFHGTKTQENLEDIINNGFNKDSVFFSSDLYDAQGYGRYIIAVRDLDSLQLYKLDKDELNNISRVAEQVKATRNYDGIKYRYSEDRPYNYEIFDMAHLNKLDRVDFTAATTGIAESLNEKHYGSYRVDKTGDGKWWVSFDEKGTRSSWVKLASFDTEEEANEFVKSKDQSLEEDIESTEIESKNNGLTSIINALIQDEWQAIQGYKDAIVNFESEGKGELTTILKDLLNEENIHVGQLEVLLQQLDSSADKIAEGEIEAQDQVISYDKGE